MHDLRLTRRGNATVALAIATVIVLLVAGGATFYLLNGRDGDRVASDRLSPEPDEPPPKPLFEGWEPPVAVIVFTGEQHGYLEPCGCTELQTGGLGRRADLFRDLREERGWNVTGFDLGAALNPQRVGRRQERMKFDVTRAALRHMGYDAMAWGPEEIRLTAGGLFDIFSAEQGAGDTTPEFVCANVALFGERGAVETPREYLLTPAGEATVAVTAVVGESVWRTLFPEGLGPDQVEFGFEPPAEALQRVLPEMTAAAPDLTVLLSHCSVDESRELAEQFPQFDIVVTAGGREDPQGEPEQIGETWLLQVGRKGKHAGVVGLYPEGAEPRLRYELVSLHRDRFDTAPVMHELMREYQQRLEQEYYEITSRELPTPNGAEFVGVETCAECHTKAYAVWSESRHSHAYESLKIGREGVEDWIDRIYDPECLCCHTTGWDPQQALRYESGFVHESSTPHLLGQQCENCHGAGGRHVKLEWAVRDGASVTEEVVAARRELHLTKEWARENLCIRCHDLDNSPTFDTEEKPFDTYWWPKVQHQGKD